jgi:hypothetical protein
MPSYAAHRQHTSRRFLLYVLGSLVCIPAVNWVLLPIDVKDLWINIPIALFYGFFAAWRRPGILFGGVLFVGVGAGCLYATGYAVPISALPLDVSLSIGIYFVLGTMLGWSEGLKRIDDM